MMNVSSSRTLLMSMTSPGRRRAINDKTLDVTSREHFYLPMIRKFKASFLRNFAALVGFFGGQCNAIAAQRLRRGIQMATFYQRFYNESSIQKMSAHLNRRLKSKPLLLAIGAIFSWDKERITKGEMESIMQELSKALPEKSDLSPIEHNVKTAVVNASTLSNEEGPKIADDWELIIEKPLIKLWRRPVDGSHLYEYRVYGSYDDISARSFYNVQVDLRYRREWDKLVIKLDVIDKDEESGSELVRWITHFPFPMHSREYVYTRRQETDERTGQMLLTARATCHPDLPLSTGCVRVTEYESSMLIRPKHSIDDNGLEYVLTYFDDPRSSFPTACYNWLASTGVPDFVDKIHDAAKNLQELDSRSRKQLETCPVSSNEL